MVSVSKTSFIVLGLALAVVLLISSEVAAKDLVSANGAEDVNYDDINGGGLGGYGEGPSSYIHYRGSGSGGQSSNGGGSPGGNGGGSRGGNGGGSRGSAGP